MTDLGTMLGNLAEQAQPAAPPAEAEPMPCPYCASANIRSSAFFMHCDSCGAGGPSVPGDWWSGQSWRPPRDALVKAWNRRAAS